MAPDQIQADRRDQEALIVGIGDCPGLDQHGGGGAVERQDRGEADPHHESRDTPGGDALQAVKQEGRDDPVLDVYAKAHTLLSGCRGGKTGR